MIPRRHVVSAVLRRDVAAYFSSPTGYIFITVFVLLGSLAAFGPDLFFDRNLANLDTLTTWFPYLCLFFIPAVTMGTWAEERRQGTAELLLTLPATEGELVLGKYLGALTVFLVALVFSLSHVVVLTFLGAPDIGLMLATYVGYAALGATLVALGMLGSLLATSPTVAFLFGGCLVAALVFVEDGAGLLNFRLGRTAPLFPFREAARGVVTVATVCSVAVMVGAALLLAVIVLRVRRRAEIDVHGAARLTCLLVGGTAAVVLAHLFGWRVDCTAEQLVSLAPETRRMLTELDGSKPVYLRAFLSPEVSREYAPVRQTLDDKLREYAARAGRAIVLDLKEAPPFSEAAREAEDRFGIRPERVGARDTEEAILGVAATCGPEEVVVPFFHVRTPVEYELTRTVRVAAQAKRKRLGVLTTDLKVFGGFDFNRMTTNPSWDIVDELKKQYAVVEVNPDNDYPGDLDALLAVMPSTLTQEQMDTFVTYVQKGKPTLILDDPLPFADPSQAPAEPKGAGRNPFMGGGPPPKSKGDFEKAFRDVGIRWPARDVVYQRYNPHPTLANLPPELVFVGAGNGNARAFNPDEVITRGLQEVVLIHGGRVEAASDTGGPTFTPLLTTGTGTGIVRYDQLMQRSWMGQANLNPNPPRRDTKQEYVMAARVKGDLPAAPGASPLTTGGKVDLIVIADVDVIASQFFAIRRQGPKELEFDNVTLVLNCIDVLAGDESFVELRKRRTRHRTLATLEEAVRAFEQDSANEVKAAEERAEKQLAEAKDRLDQAVKELRDRQDLDAQAKAIMVRQREVVENRRLEVAQSTIEGEKSKAIRISRIGMEQKIRRIRNRVRMLAVVLPPIPALCLALFMVVRRRTRRDELGADAPATGGTP